MAKGIDEAKEFRVIAGPKHNPVVERIQLNGVLPEEPLTPKLARRAARAAFGHSSQVTVWSANEEHGYRLYKRSARKIWKEQ